MSRSYDLIINRQAGAVLKEGEDMIARELSSVFGRNTGEILFVNGAEIANSVRDWAEERAGGGSSLIIGGGDGSVLTAVSEVLGRDIALGVLPMGTQNFVARQLGFSSAYREAARQYRNSQAAAMDIGVVNGMYFLYGLMLDSNSVRFFEMRERLREGRYLACLKDIYTLVADFLAGPKKTVQVSADEEDGKTLVAGRVFAVTNNLLAPRPNTRIWPFADFKTLAGNSFAKESCDGGRLGFYAFRGGTAHLPVLLKGLHDGTWHEDGNVTFRQARKFEIRPSKSSAAAVSLILDGEIRRTNFPLIVRILPGAVRLYRPS